MQGEGSIMKKRAKKEAYLKLVVKVIILLAIGIFAWNALHKLPRISQDIYPYLQSLPADLVLECQDEGEELSLTGWADLLAIRSTLAEDEQHYIIQQLKIGIPFKKLSWQNDWIQIPQDQIKKITWRRKILLEYPLYEPGRYVFPVIGEIWYMDTFGADREGGMRKHEGTDIFGQEGIPIISVCDGKVEKLGWNRLGGERVGIRGEDGNYYYYAHLKAINPYLEIGQKIKKGDFLGTLGRTGDAITTPDHLHFGIQLPNDEWINPYPFVYVWEKSSYNPLKQTNNQ